MKSLKKSKRQTGFLMLNNTKELYRICDVKVANGEVILSMFSPIA